jgi:hypothetical protein
VYTCPRNPRAPTEPRARARADLLLTMQSASPARHVRHDQDRENHEQDECVLSTASSQCTGSHRATSARAGSGRRRDRDRRRNAGTRQSAKTQLDADFGRAPSARCRRLVRDVEAWVRSAWASVEPIGLREHRDEAAHPTCVRLARPCASSLSLPARISPDRPQLAREPSRPARARRSRARPDPGSSPPPRNGDQVGGVRQAFWMAFWWRRVARVNTTSGTR